MTAEKKPKGPRRTLDERRDELVQRVSDRQDALNNAVDALAKFDAEQRAKAQAILASLPKD